MEKRKGLICSWLLLIWLLSSSGLKADPPTGDYIGKSIKHDGVYYFALTSPNRIVRYDLVAGNWLTPISLSRRPTSLWVDDDGVFAGQGRRVVSVAANGNETLLGQMSGTVDGLYATDTGYLVAVNSGDSDFLSISIDNPSQKILFDGRDRLLGLSIAPGSNRAFGRDTGVGPSDIHWIDYNEAGEIVEVEDSPHHGNYPDAKRTFAFPDGRRVADDSGTVYNSIDLTYSGSLDALLDLDFVGGDVAVALRNRSVEAYSTTLLPTGQIPVTAGGLRLAVRSDDVLVFYPDAASPNDLRVESYALAGLNLATPGDPRSPVGLSYDPEGVFVDGSGVIHLLNKANLSLFRWSIAERRYIDTFPLGANANQVAYSEANNKAYLVSPEKKITQLDLSDGSELPFVDVEFSSLKMLAVDSGLLVRINELTMYSANGEVVSNLRDAGSPVGWSPANRLLYEYSGLSLEARKINPDGTLEEQIQSSAGERRPAGNVWVSEGGSRLVSEQGDLHDAHSLARFTSLPRPDIFTSALAGAVWLGDGEFVSAREVDGRSVVERYVGPPLSAVETRLYDGAPRGLFEAGDELVLASLVKGVLRFTVLDPVDLSPAFISPAPPAEPRDLAVLARAHDRVELAWTNGSDNAEGYSVEYRQSGAATWSTPLVVSQADTTQLEVTGLPSGVEMELRVSAFNPTGTSVPSAVLRTSTLTHPDSPAGELYSLVVERAYATSVTLGWVDNAPNETGFRIFRTDRFLPLEEWDTFEVPAGSVQFVDTGVSADTSYSYRLAAFNGTVLGDISPSVSVRTAVEGAQPQGTNVNLEATAPDTVELTWGDNSGNEDGFIVMRSDERAIMDTGQEIGRVGVNVTTFTDMGLEPGATYYYAVLPFNEFGFRQVTNGRLIELPAGDVSDFLGHSVLVGDVFHFSFRSPERIERFDVTSSTWLEPIPLWGRATALATDGSQLLVGRVGSVVEVRADASERHIMSPSSATITQIVLLGGGQIIVSGIGNKPNSTGLLAGGGRVDTISSRLDFVASSAPATGRRIYGIKSDPDRSSMRVGFVQLAPDARVASSSESPIFQGQPDVVTESFMYPDGSRLIANSGHLFTTGNIIQLVGKIDAVIDVAFAGSDVPVALRAGTITAYDRNLLETGSINVDTEGAFELAIVGDEVLVFYADVTTAPGVRSRRFPLAGLNPASPTDLDRPEGVDFLPGDLLIDRDGIAYILSREFQRLFRWSPDEQRFLPGIPLDGVAESLAYSPELHRIYARYADGHCGKIELGGESPVEAPFAELVFINGSNFRDPPTITAVGRNLLELNVFSEQNLVVYNSAGERVSTLEIENAAPYYAWHGGLGVALSPGTAGNSGMLEAREISEDGTLGETSTFSPNNFRFHRSPFIVRPDGREIFTGSGTIYDGVTLDIKTELDRDFRGGAWFGEQLVTGEHVLGDTSEVRVIAWDQDDLADRALAVPGEFLGMGSLPGDKVLLATVIDGQLNLVVLGSTLSAESGMVRELAPEFLSAPRPAGVEWGATLRLEADVFGSGGLTYTWFRDGEIVGNTEVLELEGVRFSDGGTYQLRVTNASGELMSDELPVVVGRPVEPLVQPGNLLVTRNSEFVEYTPDWEEVGAFEVEGATSPRGQINALVVDRFGRVIVHNYGFSGRHHSSLYSPHLDSWQHVSRSGPTDVNFSLRGDYFYVGSDRFGLIDGERDPDWSPPGGRPITAGQDGRIYAVSGLELLELDPQDGSELRKIELEVGLRAVNSNTAGEIYLATQDNRLLHMTPAGEILADVNLDTLYPGDRFRGRVVNIALNASGDLVIGTSRPEVFTCGPGLVDLKKQELGDWASYATWIPHFVTFDTEPAEGPQLEDAHYEYAVNFAHSDPTADLTIEAELPHWLQLIPSPDGAGKATVSGVPATDAEAGFHEVVLTASSPGMLPSVQRFMIEVQAVNDRPVAAVIDEIDLVEDQGIHLVILSDFFTDEEDSVLQFQATAVAGGDSLLDHSLQGNVLTLTPKLNANGVAEIALVATDSGGLEVSSMLRVAIAPVPDAPVGSTIPPVEAGADAAPATLDLTAYFSDVDAGDQLTFSITSNTDPSIFDALTIDPESGQLAISFANFVSGSAVIKVRATDESGLFAEEEIAVRLPAIPQPTAQAGAVILNRQTGLFEQRVVVTNTGGRAIGGVELTVSGLAAGASVYNASGGEPSIGQWLVQHDRPLEAGESLTIWLEYYSLARTLSGGGEIGVRHQIPLGEQEAAEGSETFAIDRVVQLEDGALLIEFSSVPGDRYRIQYSGDQRDWLDSPTPLRAGGTRVQWIDRGAPKTLVPPSEVESRFYRVLKD